LLLSTRATGTQPYRTGTSVSSRRDARSAPKVRGSSFLTWFILVFEQKRRLPGALLNDLGRMLLPRVRPCHGRPPLSALHSPTAVPALGVLFYLAVVSVCNSGVAYASESDFLANAFGEFTPGDVLFGFPTVSAGFAFNDRPDVGVNNYFPLCRTRRGVPYFARVCGTECDKVTRRVTHFPECVHTSNVVFFSRVHGNIFPECDKASPPTRFAAIAFSEKYPTFPGALSVDFLLCVPVCTWWPPLSLNLVWACVTAYNESLPLLEPAPAYSVYPRSVHGHRAPFLSSHVVHAQCNAVTPFSVVLVTGHGKGATKQSGPFVSGPFLA